MAQQISKKMIKDALDSLKVVMSMLQAANEGSGRFTELMKGVEKANKIIEIASANTSKEIKPEPIPVRETAPEKMEPISGGRVSPLKPSEVGLGSSEKRGGKVSPVKG